MKRFGQAGFTLMELLVSVGVLIIVAALLVQVLFTTTHVNKKTDLINDVKLNGNFALDVISRFVRSARNVSCGSGSMIITNPDLQQTTFTCISDGTAARIASQSASQTVYLTSGYLTVNTSGGSNSDCADSTLAFSCVPPAVTVTFTLRQLGVPGAAYEGVSAAFQSISRMRN